MSHVKSEARPQLTVLLVEDDENQRVLITHRLRGDASHMEVLEAANLARGLELLAQRRPGLPDAVGTDGVIALRTAAPGTPLIVLTGSDDETFGLTAVAEGADEYVQKNVDNTNSLAKTILYAIERRRSTEQARRRHRLESLGSLAGGVAHEINNPITIILNCAELILDDVTADSAIGANAKYIVDAANRVAGITGRLLAFARDHPHSAVHASLPELVQNSARLLGRRQGDAEFLFKHEEGILFPAVHCHEQDIQQVFVDLLVNAQDATRARHLPSGHPPAIVISQSLVDDAGTEYLRTTVEDKGRGIPASVLEKIFDPFYSVPDDSPRSIGMGLAISRSVVLDHGGRLWLESQENVGTVAYVDLPTDRRVTAGQ